jgi:hypothetical protein
MLVGTRIFDAYVDSAHFPDTGKKKSEKNIISKTQAARLPNIGKTPIT